MPTFHYVYVLESMDTVEHYYVGLTEDLASRLAKHNSGAVPHSSKHRPWLIKNAFAFINKQKAAAFERYLKTSSGRSFAKRHF